MSMRKILFVLALGALTVACGGDPAPVDGGGGGTDAQMPDGGGEADSGGGELDGGGGGGACAEYCTTVTTNCTGDNAQYADMAACLAYCSRAGWPEGEPGATGGNSIACRTYHGGAPAAATPAEHCPHAGPTGAGVCGAAITFRTDAPTAYTRVDRMGMPAVSTALIPSDRKNAYNDANPTDDAALDFLPDMAGTLTALHGVLDADDLVANGLTPCSMTVMENGLPQCVGQEIAPGVTVASLVVPDTLHIDPTAASGFPNGRELDDPVIDVTLAVILLDMGGVCGTGVICGPGTFAAGSSFALAPLNPPANDVAFGTTFPYLAPAHTP